MKPDTSFLDDFLDKDIEEIERLYKEKLRRKENYGKLKKRKTKD